MAKIIDMELHRDVLVRGAYWMVGVVQLCPYHQIGFVEWWVYRDETGRRSLKEGVILSPSPRVEITHDNYVKYFSPEALSKAGSNVTEAAYRMCAEQLEPHGLKTLFETAEDH